MVALWEDRPWYKELYQETTTIVHGQKVTQKVQFPPWVELIIDHESMSIFIWLTDNDLEISLQQLIYLISSTNYLAILIKK